MLSLYVLAHLAVKLKVSNIIAFFAYSMLLMLMGILKRQRHEVFCREYLACDNGAEAYRRTAKRFPGSGRWPDGVTNAGSHGVIACNILKRPEVKKRITELRSIMAKKADITLDKVLSNIEEAITMARSQAKPNDMTNAAMAQARLVGLDKQRVEFTTKDELESMETSAILERLEKEIGPAAALALAQKYGLTVDDEPQAEELAKAIPPSDAVN